MDHRAVAGAPPRSRRRRRGGTSRSWGRASLAASWFTIWGLYSAYTWTTDPTSVTVQIVRFYVPAIGPIALLGAWLVTRIPGRAWLAGLTSTAVIAALFGLGVWSFYAMYAALSVPLSR